MNILEGRFAPTPLYLLDTDENNNRVFIKREDLLPYAFGGNKARIGIEYLRDMRAKGRDHLLAYGNPRSNLCRALSNLCAGLGVPITILSPADDDGERRPSFNGRMCAALGARIIPCLKTNVAQSVEKALADIRRGGGKPYYLYGDPLGKGNEAVPTAAYAGMGAELAGQEAELGAAFDAMFLAVGTGMTQAGLLCAHAAHAGAANQSAVARNRRVIGVSVARDEESVRGHVRAYADAYAGAAGHAARVPPERVEVCAEFRETYGQCSKAVAALIREAMARYGVPFDGTYTGKAFYGMGELLRRWGWHGRDVLFLHTGGTPLFFDGLETWEENTR